MTDNILDDFSKFFDNPIDRFMAEAIKEARKAEEAGDVPIGAVIVHDGMIIARAHNQVEALRDATAHAEIIAITQASAHFDNWRLSETTLVVTKEPCPMCAGAIMNARVGKVVFGVYDPKYGAAGSVYPILTDDKMYHKVELLGGVREDECRQMIQNFFQKVRKK